LGKVGAELVPRRTKKKQSKEEQKKSLLHPLEPRTAGQEIFLQTVKEHPVVICDGPAGTGKTFMSFGHALRMYLFDEDISRIIIVRPTIPAGDEPSLGYLPGTLNDKMSPYLAPILRDSAPLLIKKIPRSAADNKFIERFGNPTTDSEIILAQFDIEAVPLHLMRGRNFHNAFVILDEAQNCTMEDFKLFLTRIGKKCRIVIEGDSTQKDRDRGALPELMRKLRSAKYAGIVKLTKEDIVRNPIIADILKRL
jgi:phosphate starvation-inducible PhoH-like protein